MALRWCCPGKHDSGPCCCLHIPPRYGCPTSRLLCEKWDDAGLPFLCEYMGSFALPSMTDYGFLQPRFEYQVERGLSGFAQLLESARYDYFCISGPNFVPGVRDIGCASNYSPERIVTKSGHNFAWHSGRNQASRPGEYRKMTVVETPCGDCAGATDARDPSTTHDCRADDLASLRTT